ncbi:MAG TPA: YfiR family protein [Bryobacteraceae bacterium]|nr:YfiR family protein [Bryobacteraceae bacterium]
MASVDGLAQTATEYEVKAAFLYKFASFVEWPADRANAPLCIAILGRDPFGPTLDEVVRGKSINGRSFEIRRMKSGQDTAWCHIVFISDSEKNHLRLVIGRFQGTSILTVSDIPGFCREGGVIEFELRDQTVHFDINLDASERARLKISSKLLGVARIVRERKP